MISAFTFEILNIKPALENKNISGNKEISESKTIKESSLTVNNKPGHERIENFIILLPILVMLIGIIIMTILYNLFY